MIKATSKIKMNFPRIRQLSQAAVTALETTGERLHEVTQQAQVFPFDKGTLQGDSTFLDTRESGQGRVTLVSDTPYARRLYYHPEYDFQTEDNPNAKGNWYEDWLPGGNKADFAPKTFKQIYKKVGGV